MSHEPNKNDLDAPSLEEWLSLQTLDSMPIKYVAYEDYGAQAKLDNTVEILRELFNAPNDPIHAHLIAQTKIKRLWTPVTYVTRSLELMTTTIPPLKSKAEIMSTLLAVYAIKANPQPCNSCKNYGHRGPFESCIVPAGGAVEHGGGSCTNCWYTGKGKNCSIRLKIEERRAEKKWYDFREASGKLETLEIEELVHWLEVLEAEERKMLAEHARLMGFAGAQEKGKKRRGRK
ncbi:hypothetical protein OQA88_8030 [Cercophora sp. LCS_1]